MDNGKVMLMLVAVLAVGIFALPSTVAMFGGQHNWYDLEPSGNDVPCEKCHADVFDELYNNVGPHDEMQCWYCHRTSNLTGYTYASGDGTTSVPGQEAHAASTVECMACHEGFVGDATEFSNCTDCHISGSVGDDQPMNTHPFEWVVNDDGFCIDCHVDYDDSNKYPSTHGVVNLAAGGFGLTVDAPGGSGTDLDTGANAAHMAFVDDSIGDPLMDGANEACITCHTHTAIDINWTHAYSMKLDAVQDSTGNWSCINFKTNGYYNITTYGNMSGNTTAVNGTAGISGNYVTPP